MKLSSTPTGFGRIEDDVFVPMGEDIVRYLERGASSDGQPLPLAEVQLLAPIPRPGKVICVGLNYRDHAEETGQAIPDEPVLFSKFANSVVGPGADVMVPRVVTQPDFEAELAIVIGRRATGVPALDALSYVAGYTCANDVSARDLQFRSSQWLLGKAIDSFLPLGPWLVTADEVPDPQKLGLWLEVSGELMQDGSTANMVFTVAQLVSYVSRFMTLEPGDLIATGTPAGVGMGRQRFLKPGDTLRLGIAGLGEQSTTVHAWDAALIDRVHGAHR